MCQSFRMSWLLHGQHFCIFFIEQDRVTNKERTSTRCLFHRLAFLCKVKHSINNLLANKLGVSQCVHKEDEVVILIQMVIFISSYYI